MHRPPETFDMHREGVMDRGHRSYSLENVPTEERGRGRPTPENRRDGTGQRGVQTGVYSLYGWFNKH